MCRYVLAVFIATLPAIGIAKEDQQAWDVNEPHSPKETVAFTTTEGTWMNLDISPDAPQIVFDLLGGLYVLPIEGGEARRITSGPAFDLQPRHVLSP